jgi:hypothetical protein
MLSGQNGWSNKSEFILDRLASNNALVEKDNGSNRIMQEGINEFTIL